jgi:hypothetical protein
MTITCANDSNLFTNNMQVISYIQGKQESQTHQALDLKFSIPSCDQGEVIKLELPCKTPNPHTVYRLKIVLFYTCTDGQKRLYNSLEKVRLSRSVGVNHKLLYPSPDFALLRVNIVGEDDNPIRIVSMDLDSGTKVKRSLIGKEHDLIVRFHWMI